MNRIPSPTSYLDPEPQSDRYAQEEDDPDRDEEDEPEEEVEKGAEDGGAVGGAPCDPSELAAPDSAAAAGTAPLHQAERGGRELHAWAAVPHVVHLEEWGRGQDRTRCCSDLAVRDYISLQGAIEGLLGILPSQLRKWGITACLSSCSTLASTTSEYGHSRRSGLAPCVSGTTSTCRHIGGISSLIGRDKDDPQRLW